MNTTDQLQNLARMIETAEASLHSARELLNQMGIHSNRVDKPLKVDDAKAYDQGENQVVEGQFDGQNMVGPNEKTYPVPANYASKSKLVEGDRLKLTIMPNGSFVYKQISPIEREFVKGTLIKEDGQFRVVANSKSYKVLLASVTYYKGNPGDEVTLIVPKDRPSVWGTLEAVIPQVSGEYNDTETF